MSASKWFTQVGDQVLQGLYAHTRQALDEAVEEAGEMKDLDISFVQVGYALRPFPITPQDYIVRGPYASPTIAKLFMDGAVERGWLEQVSEEQYAVSARGVEMVQRFLGVFNESLHGIQAPPDLDLKRIGELMQRVVDKARELPEPAEKRGLDWGKHFQKALVLKDAPELVRVRRRLLDMFAYRDDVHVAAWKPYEENGQIWEVLTLVWRDEAGTAAELAEKLPFRGYDEDSYAAALGELAERGWIALEDGKYVSTEKGKKLRQEAEDATDRYFDAPWTVLSEAETTELKGLLKKLAEAVKPPETET